MIETVNKIRRRFQYYFFKANKLFLKDKTLLDVEKIIKIKNKDLKIKKLEELFYKNKKHPFLIYHLAKAKIDSSDYSGFELLKNFEDLRMEWVKKNMTKTNEIFIPIQQVIGALGNTYSLYYYLINRIHILNNKIKPILLIKETEKITNSEVIKFLLPSLKLLKNNSIYYKKNYMYQINKAPIELGLQFKENYYPPGIAINFINQFLKKKNIIEQTVFKISTNNINECYKKLSEYGLTKKDWFVVLHIREKKSDIDKLRDSDPLTYIEAIKFIISQGGKVIRVGDRTMTKLPKIDGLIDYPFTNLKSEIMDVFLAAQCKFCLGTSSGYYSLPIFFGKPVLLVNYLNTAEFFALREGDLFLPKKLVYKKNDQHVKIKDVFGLQIGNYMTTDAYEKNNILIKNNSSDEILGATKEMINILFNKENKELDISNKQFKKEVDDSYYKLFDYPISTLAKVSNSYLKNFYN